MTDTEKQWECGGVTECAEYARKIRAQQLLDLAPYRDRIAATVNEYAQREIDSLKAALRLSEAEAARAWERVRELVAQQPPPEPPTSCHHFLDHPRTGPKRCTLPDGHDGAHHVVMTWLAAP